jgi:hypothetical protein
VLASVSLKIAMDTFIQMGITVFMSSKLMNLRPGQAGPRPATVSKSKARAGVGAGKDMLLHH